MDGLASLKAWKQATTTKESIRKLPISVTMITGGKKMISQIGKMTLYTFMFLIHSFRRFLPENPAPLFSGGWGEAARANHPFLPFFQPVVLAGLAGIRTICPPREEPPVPGFAKDSMFIKHVSFPPDQDIRPFPSSSSPRTAFS
jgi:hypothetical protein